MSEYTPTTEEVRNEWAGSRADSYAAEAEFDRWLAGEVEREAAARALTEAANAWQINGWAHDMPKKGAERAQIILHVAQAATEMLRARAAEIREGRP